MITTLPTLSYSELVTLPCRWNVFKLLSLTQMPFITISNVSLMILQQTNNGFIMRWRSSRSTGSRFVQIIWIRPPLNIIRIWPRLFHVIRKIKKYIFDSARTEATRNAHFVSHTHFSQWYLLAARYREPHLLFHACMCMQKSLFITFSEPHTNLSIAFAGLQECYPYSMLGNIILQNMCSRPIACTNPLPPLKTTFLCLQAYG